MCLLVFAWQKHPRYPLILAGNRDEFHCRPARAAQWWEEAPDFLAGRDLQAGGTWLGLNRNGRFGVITNFREGTSTTGGGPSRGDLVGRFANLRTDADTFLADLRSGASGYAGYNLIFGDLAAGSLHYFSNRGASESPLPAGVHGLSNHFLNTPWPKVTRTVARLDELLDQDRIDPDDLLSLLADRTVADDAALPRTGLSPEFEKLLSAPFIVSPEYGTRCSTVLLLDRDGGLEFREARFHRDGAPAGRSEFRVGLNACAAARSVTG